MPDTKTNGGGPVLTGNTGSAADALTEKLVLEAQDKAVPEIGAQQTCEMLFNAMLFIAARNGADPKNFQNALVTMALGAGDKIRLLRDVGGV